MSYQDTVQTMRVLQERIAELEAELAEVLEERDELRHKLIELAEQSVYHGNSVAYIYDKMTAYKKNIGDMCDAVGDYRKQDESVIDAAARMKAERDKLKDKIESAVETLQYSEDTHALVALKILTKGDNQ